MCIAIVENGDNACTAEENVTILLCISVKSIFFRDYDRLRYIFFDEMV